MKIDYTRHYRKWHSDDPAHVETMCRFYRRTLQPWLPPDLKARVLDVGCGMGFALLGLKSLGYADLSGLDADEGQVASCRQKGLEVAWVPDTFAHLTTMAGACDVILLLDVLEHIPVSRQIEFLARLHAALRPGGRLILTVPNANSVLAPRWRYVDWTHTSSFTECSLDFVLGNAGFSRIEINPYEFVVKPRFWWLPVRGRRHYWRFRFFRWWRRMELIAELGEAQGRAVPLSLNLLAVAHKD